MDKIRELIGAVRTINHGPYHEIMIPDDDEPVCYQRNEWIKWILELAGEAEKQLVQMGEIKK